MDFLYRDDAPFGAEQWNAIDETVIGTARQVLVGRRFIPINGPLGAGAQSVIMDGLGTAAEAESDFFGDGEAAAIKVNSRKHVEIPMIYKDFLLSWRDIENASQYHLPLDLSQAASAAAICARKEDDLIFNGNAALGYDGLLNAKGAQTIAKSDWAEGANPFSDVAKGIEALVAKGFSNRLTLVVGPGLYTQLQRIQPGLGILESERVKSLVEGRLYQTPALGADRAVLVSAEFRNIDLTIGQDLITAYLGPEKMNHGLRVFETALLRIKNPAAIVVF